MEANLKEKWSKTTLGPYGKDPTKETPFKIVAFPNLFEEKVVNQLRDDINSSVKLKLKDNDLYKFQQSKDFKTEIPSKKLTPLVHELIDVMLGPVKEHLENEFSLKLSSTSFDITASRYDVGNYLLCHNDDVKASSATGNRALAFIYYLNSKPWSEDDGGALLLFDSDSTGEPIKINNSMSPKPNTLVVFRTTPRSWHSVQEVCCKDDFRLSINGWFYIDNTRRTAEEQSSIESCPYYIVKPIALNERLEKFFKECINQEYLMEKTCFSIRKRFKKTSEINLINFLVKDKYDEISDALKKAAANKENLIHVGPYNKRNYKKLKVNSLPQICQDLYEAFQSELFFMLLARMTGLELQPPSLKFDKAESSGGGDEQNDDNETDDDDDDDEESPSDEDDDSSSNSSSSGDEPDSESKNFYPTSAGGEKNGSSKSPETTEKNPKNITEAIFNSTESPKKRKRTSNPMARLEYRHLDTGTYTIIHDHAFELGEKSALDVILHFNHDFAVNFEDGGYFSYIDGAEDDMHDMDCELLTVEPKSNSLSLVYRCDEAEYRFFKHINKSHKSDYQDLYCVYYERPEDLPNLGSNDRSSQDGPLTQPKI